MDCRLILDPPAEGAWNMAVDQALLEAIAVEGLPVLRLYRWREPTLTLGYFQPHRQREQHAESRDCPLLRRSTGGGAIVHDRELTYSLVLPAQWVPHASTEIYDRVHQEVAALLTVDQLVAALHPANPVEAAETLDPRAFLCFQRRSAGDLVLWAGPQDGTKPVGHKVLGSAQRKSGGAILQHGSLLLERSMAAPQLAGINDFLPVDLRWDADRASERLSAAVAARFGWKWIRSELTSHELELAQQIRTARFLNPDWTFAR